MVRTLPPLSELYLVDETARLDAMAELIGAGAFTELDHANLREYLQDMANRDRREVKSRFLQLLLHILEWEFQPDKRTGSWKRSIIHQSYELRQDAQSGVLRNHLETQLADVFGIAVLEAAAETGLPEETFPAECPYTLDELLAYEAAE